jgi:probable HAF family extracellular repeat protein
MPECRAEFTHEARLSKGGLVKHRIALLAFMATGAFVVTAGARQFDMTDRPDATAYRIDRLAPLGGPNLRGNSINDTGLVAGFADREGGQSRRAVTWSHNQPLDLGTLGGPNSSVAWPVKNNDGLIVGIAQTSVPHPRAAQWSCRAFFPGPDNATYQCLGFVWEPGGTMLPLPTLGGDNGFATAANNHRQVVGWAETATIDESCVVAGGHEFHAVLWDLAAQETRELIPLGDDSSSAATAINDRGQVVGISGDCDQAVGRFSAKHAVLWENGMPLELDNLGGDAWHTPMAINQAGDMIVGFGTLPGDNPLAPRLRAFLWTTREGLCEPLPGTMICDLGTLDGHATAQAAAVNDRGQIVGTSCPASGASTLCSAFLWERGVMTDLNTRKGSGFSDHLEHGQDINESGQITGRAANLTTLVRSAFRATPRPGKPIG